MKGTDIAKGVKKKVGRRRITQPHLFGQPLHQYQGNRQCASSSGFAFSPIGRSQDLQKNVALLIQKVRMSKGSDGEQAAVSHTYKNIEVQFIMQRGTPKSKATPYRYNGKPFI